MTDDRALQETCISRLGEQDNHEGKAQVSEQALEEGRREGSSGKGLLRDLSSLGNSDFLNVYMKGKALARDRTGASGISV